MTVRDALREGASGLPDSDSPFLDATLLLAHILGTSKETLLASFPDELAPESLEALNALVARRANQEPLAYILGYREFYGHRFTVDARVLDPRPDTEILVERALALIDRGLSRVHDCCTGSGCVAISLALERPAATVTASDLSPDAVTVARGNAESLGAAVEVHEGSLLDGVVGPIDLVVANPPYLSDHDMTVWPNGHEPDMALRGGGDGLELPKRLARQALAALRPGGALLMEAGYDQMVDLGAALEEIGYHTPMVHQDLAGRDRVIEGWKK